MKVNIYYGGRGLVEDPTIYVMNKLQQVLEELNVTVTRYNLYELKNTITTLSQTVHEADGIILATTVEWFGMGGYMQLFLDSCWLYTDKSKLGKTYMFPVVMSRTYGEREVSLSLINAWEMLGGISRSGLSAYVDDESDFQSDKQYSDIIEKYAEDIYRTISKKQPSLPGSGQAIKNTIMKEVVKLTPQESEQLSKYASDDDFIMTQKKDIESLASIYKELLNDEENGGDSYYINVFKDSYNNKCEYEGSYMIMISDKNVSVVVDVRDHQVTAQFGDNTDADIIAKLNKATFDEIVGGRLTFHQAFMTGDMTAKGNFKSLKMMDELFRFQSK